MQVRAIKKLLNNTDYMINNREGFKYFWLQNRLSFNISSDHEYRGLDYTLRGYAFTDEDFDFVSIKKY